MNSMESSVSRLSMGFSALSDEYAELAGRYQRLEAQLASAQQQVRKALLRELHFPFYDDTP